jgi:tRNA threonylcarbamoyladenosine biosynthesis protein TsaE
MEHASTSPPWTYTACDERGTQLLGSALGRGIADGGVVALCGTLGAGKTRLVQAIAASLGVDRSVVNSPTFVLIQEYDAGIPIYHFDTYRLRNVEEFLDLGVDELFASKGIFLIEWADRVSNVLPPDHLRVDIEITGPTSRQFRITAAGPRSATIVAAARLALEKDEGGKWKDEG